MIMQYVQEHGNELSPEAKYYAQAVYYNSIKGSEEVSNVKVGDFVQWENKRHQQFSEPRRVVHIEKCMLLWMGI